MLKATLDGIFEVQQAHEDELAQTLREHEAAKVELRSISGNAPLPKKTFLGGLVHAFTGMSSDRIAQLKDAISVKAGRIEALRHLIQDHENDKEQAIKSHLLATDEHYRTESIKWDAVVRLRHSLEMYDKAANSAAQLINGIRSGESARRDSGLRPYSNQNLLERPETIAALGHIKNGYEGFGSAVEDMALHYGDKVTCSITITYHGGSMKFDIYKHPEHLSLYKIESLEEALIQIDGMRRAITLALQHVEGLYRETIASRIRYHNRLVKSLPA